MNIFKYKIKREFRILNELTQEQKDRIKQLRADGLSYNSIADIMNISRYTAYFHCLSDSEKIEFYNKVRHRPSKETERNRQRMFRQRKIHLYEIGGLYKKGEEDD